MERPVLFKQELKSLTADERIELIRVKVERANKHIVDLEHAISVFLQTKPYGVGCKRDPKISKLIYYASDIQPVPAEIAAIAGDAIHNTRSVLDHLMIQMFLVGPNPAFAESKHAKFFYGADAKDFESTLNGVIQSLRPDAVDALRSIEPYKGGKGHPLWMLHELDIIDKHRLLMTIGCRLADIRIEHRNTPNVSPTSLSGMFGQRKGYLPLQTGDELSVVYGQFAKHMQFVFEIALDEPSVIECEPLLETVKHLHDLVRGVFNILGPCLK